VLCVLLILVFLMNILLVLLLNVKLLSLVLILLNLPLLSTLMVTVGELFVMIWSCFILTVVMLITLLQLLRKHSEYTTVYLTVDLT